ncbi:ATP-binding cassette domain-containing protein [Reichenbachiella ulvae]|uniref:ATP-binding cassette domain-containing protein n=1 Tax=Reichenbachiella ulvae TaxID=2980104 RepID=A0ABT3CRS2_9BACT|nr:ATP-binding cassette domain-containing protein [Reichenbachiella ulvae]MCV9386411.1 ATP-binding cassette domain-containing protein [Reichenbachiella ulvae]
MLNVNIDMHFNGFETEARFSLEPGQTLGLFGPSGIGKSSLLHAIAGINHRYKGRIQFGSDPWDGDGKHLDVQKRDMSLMFQDYALFPNLNAEGNIRFNQSISNEEVDSIIEHLELRELLNRSVDDLSGGQKQRIALARLLAYDQSIWLLDEPFSAIHSDLKLRISQFIKNQIITKKKIVLISSHDMGDLKFFTNRILDMGD